MRFTELQFEPAKIQVTHEEILADLRYPVPRRRGAAPKRAKR